MNETLSEEFINSEVLGKKIVGLEMKRYGDFFGSRVILKRIILEDNTVIRLDGSNSTALICSVEKEH